MSQQSVVVKGEDRILILRMIFLDSKEPYDLVNWTKVTVQFKQSNRAILEKTTELNPATVAYFSHDGVVYSATIPGVAGNTIALSFDGLEDIDSVVNAWNTANPTNAVAYDGDGSSVPAEGAFQLSRGRDPYRDVEVINTTLGKISVRLTDADSSSLKTGPNQNIVAVVDKGEHPNGERRIIHFNQVLTVVNADL